jgi:spore maturation protein CgeB
MKKKNKKKILLVGSKEFFSLENMYLRAFKKAQCDVNIFHIYSIGKNLLFRFFWKYLKIFFFIKQRYDLLKYIKKNKNKYDLIIIYKGLYLTENFLGQLRKISHVSRFINIFPDDPLDFRYSRDISNRNLFESIKNFDYFFTYSKKIKKKLEIISQNKKIIHLPFAHDSFIHKKSKRNFTDVYDLSFIGSADKDRHDVIKKLTNYKILIAGNGWDKFSHLKNVSYLGAINAKQSAEVIRKSTISLNIPRKQNYYSHNMRTFEIPAMGGLMLTKRSSEQNIFFKENKECLMYEDFKDINNKIRMALKNKKKLVKIRNNGYKISKKYTYLSRAKYILKIIYK